MKNNAREITALILKIVTVITIMVLAIVYYDELTNIDVRLIVASATNELTAISSVISIYFIKGILFVIPASLVYISVGMAFSPLTAVLVNMLGITVELIVSYLFGMFLGGEYVSRLLMKNKGGQKLLDLKNQNKQSSVFIIRLLPVFPIDFASLFFGSMKLPFIKYIIFSVLGVAPRVILFTLLGDTIYDYIPMKLIIKAIICLIPIAAVAIIVSWIIKKRKKN